MTTKYIIFGYNFDLSMRGWVKPEVVDGYDEAESRIMEIWEHYQNEFVIDGWDGHGKDYMRFNSLEEDGAGLVAWSTIYGSDRSFLLVAKPCGKDYLVLHAYENEMEGMGIERLTHMPDRRAALKEVFDDMTVRIDDMDAPQAIVDGDNMTVYDSIGFDEHYYQIVDAR